MSSTPSSSTLCAAVTRHLRAVAPRVRGQVLQPERSTIVHGIAVLALIGLAVFDARGLAAAGVVVAVSLLLGQEHRRERRTATAAAPLPAQPSGPTLDSIDGAAAAEPIKERR